VGGQGKDPLGGFVLLAVYGFATAGARRPLYAATRVFPLPAHAGKGIHSTRPRGYHSLASPFTATPFFSSFPLPFFL
jgi:hypothetical protein